jgi:hypothetical protein
MAVSVSGLVTSWPVFRVGGSSVGPRHPQQIDPSDLRLPAGLPVLLVPLDSPAAGSSSMSKKRKRISRRRLAGQRVLAHVPTFNLETGSHKPVTAARRYIAEQALVPPALLNVRRNEHTTDRFFWGEKGLFSAQYAEENHFLFPSLREIVDRIGEEVLFEGIEALAADDWEEMEEYEYAFV